MISSIDITADSGLRNNSHWMLEAHTQYPQKFNIWAGISNNTLIRPLFIDGNLNAEV